MIKHKLFLLSLFLFYGAIAYPYTELRVTRMRYRKSHIARLHILLRLVGKRVVSGREEYITKALCRCTDRLPSKNGMTIHKNGETSTNGYQMTPKLRLMPISIAAEWHISTCICSTPCKQSVKHILKIISMP